MDIRQLDIFLEVLEHSSVTRAAETLFLSPGAVSLQIHNLAAELRTELFVRSGRRIIPTEHALRLAEHSRQLRRKLREIQQDFDNVPANDQRPFHFATGATTLIYALGRPLREIRRKYPKADVHVTVGVTEGIVAGLLERRYDLGLISLPWEHEGVTISPLFEEELLVVRPVKNPVSGRAVLPVQPKELQRASFLLYPPSSNMRHFIDGYFRDLGINPRVTMEADDTEVLKHLVEAGFGYSILPRLALRGKGYRFQTLRVPGRPLVRKQALAMAQTDYPRALTTAIADVIRSSINVSV